MEWIKISVKCLFSLTIFVFLFSLALAQGRQITNEEFKKADDEYNRLTSEINRLHNEMSKASESSDLDLYNKLKAEYDKVVEDRKKHELIRIEFMKQNKELVSIKKIYNQGNIAYKLGNTKEALARYNEAIKKGIEANSPALNETISKCYYQIGLIMKSDKKIQEAIDAYNNVVKYSPSYEQGYFALGNTYGDIDKYDLAIENYLKTIEINNSFYQAYYNMGSIYLTQWTKTDKSNTKNRVELLDNAEAAFRDAVRINPKYYQAYTSLGRILVEKNMPLEALDPLNKSVEISNNYPMHYYYLAIAYNQLKDPGNAIENAQKCLKYRRNFPPAFIEIGDAYNQLGNEKMAIEFYSKCLNNRTYRKLAEYKIDMIKNKDKYIK